MSYVLRDCLRSDYSILTRCPFVTKSRVVSTVCEAFRSKADSRSDLQQIIHMEWTKATEEKPFLFNQSKFRYFSSSYEGGVCSLQLGLTSYKAYVGSNLGRQWNLFLREGNAIGDPSAFFANPLGNQCVLVLRDNKHVLLNRSYRVAEGGGLLTCIGGHPEPSCAGIHDYSDAQSSAVTEELFDSVKREILEESNLPVECLSDLYMLGVVSCLKTHGRQVQLFCCFADLTMKDVLYWYKKGPSDQCESVGIQSLPLEGIVELINRSPERLTPETRALYAVLLGQYDRFHAFQLKHFRFSVS